MLWVSLRQMYRRAVNEIEAILAIFKRLNRCGYEFEVILDGFSTPADLLFPGRYEPGYHEGLAKRTASVGQEVIAASKRAELTHLHFYDATGCTLPEAVCQASRADYYICHHGTQQHKIGWLFDVPGIVHGNVEVSRQNPAAWVQQQAGTLNCPQYLPTRFIADAENGGERKNLAYFKNYMFVQLDELAEFVVEDILRNIAMQHKIN